MVSKLPILLDEETATALIALAKREYRDPRQQAVVIIRQGLERCGLLTEEPIHPEYQKREKGASQTGKL